MFSSNMVKHFLLIIVLVFTTKANLLAGLKIPGIVAKTKPAVALVRTWDSKGNHLSNRILDLLRMASWRLVTAGCKIVKYHPGRHPPRRPCG
jgi:hypothetical protein